MPGRALVLSPDHAVFVDNVLVPVRYLVNGATIAPLVLSRVTYWHVELPRHDVMLAENLPAESFLDTGNRHAFENCGPALALHPEFALGRWAAAGCAPLVLGGATLHAIRADLLARAADLGFTRDVATRLDLVGPTGALAGRHTDGHHRWSIPTAGIWHLRSDAEAPAHITPDGTDHRRLGVAIAALRLDAVDLPRTDPRLGAGWHGDEPQPDGGGWRWTDGNAAITTEGPATLELEVAMGAPVWRAPLIRRGRARHG